jgi:hypothetical protein
MAVTTSTVIDTLVPDIIAEARNWLSERSLFWRGSGPLSAFIEWKDLSATPGLTAQFNTWAAVAMAESVEDVDFATTQTMTPSGTTLTAIREMGVIKITDLASGAYAFGSGSTNFETAQTDDLVQKAGELLGIATATEFDISILETFASLTTAVTVTNTDPTLATWEASKHSLRVAKVPTPYASVMHPTAWKLMLSEAGSPLRDISKTGAIAESVWGDFYECEVEHVPIFTHADCVTATAGADWSGAIFGKDAIGCVLKSMFHIETERRATQSATYIVGKMDWKAGVARSTRGIHLLSDVD